MNIIKALRLVGGCPVVEGFWQNVSMAVGLMGAIVMIFSILIFKMSNWIAMSLLLALLIMAILPIYLPRKQSNLKK